MKAFQSLAGCFHVKSCITDMKKCVTVLKCGPFAHDCARIGEVDTCACRLGFYMTEGRKCHG